MRILLAIIFSVISIATFAKKPHVRKVTATNYHLYETKHGKIRERKQLDYYAVYDSIGHEVEVGKYGRSHCYEQIGKSDSGGVVVQRACSWDYSKIGSVEFYKYDSLNRKVRTENWYYCSDPKGRLSSYVIYSYNVGGAIYKETEYDDSNKIKEITYYDAVGGRIYKETVYDDSNKISKIKHYDYNTVSNVVEVIDTDFGSRWNPGIWVINAIRKYDNKNRLLDQIEYYNGKISFREQYRYGKYNNVTIFRYDDNDSIPSLITEKTFDDSLMKRPLEVFEKYINSGESREVYTYDENGLKEKVELYEKLERTSYTTFDYEYY